MDASSGNPFEVANVSLSHELQDQLVADERKILLQVRFDSIDLTSTYFIVNSLLLIFSKVVLTKYTLNFLSILLV